MNNTKTITDYVLPFLMEYSPLNNHGPRIFDGADLQIQHSGGQYRAYQDDGKAYPYNVPPECNWVQIACSGYNIKERKAIYATFEFDYGHSDNQITVEQREELVKLLDGHCDIIRSTGGEGLHCRAWFDKPIPCDSRAEYSRICEAAIARLVETVGEDFAPLIESKGCILWLASVNHNEDSFRQLSRPHSLIDSKEVVALVRPAPAKKAPTLFAGLVEPNVVEALKFIDADDFHTWTKMGLILKNEGDHYYEVWAEWSSKSTKSEGCDLESQWDILQPNGTMGLGSLFHLAKQAGWRDTTTFKNYSVSGDAIKAIPLVEIASQLSEVGLMPNRIDNQLFVDCGEVIRHLKTKDDFFAYLKSEIQVDWKNRISCGVRDTELFCHLQYVASEFKEVSHLPHYPRVEGIYYCHGDFVAGNKLEGLLDFFSPETADDRQLLKAALITQFWGGPCGSRPVMNITADSGRGSGKTTVAEKIGDIAGGCLSVLSTDTEKLATRLLSPDASDKRIVLFDNLKSDRFDWDGAEHLITAAMISGRRLYHGDGQRLNLLTWFITINGGQLSTDMAQRSVIIKLAKPKNDPTWLTRLNAYIEENRKAIIGDCLATLAGPRNDIGPCSRWATWEGEVLAVLDDPKQLQKLIISRQLAIDADRNDALAIEEAIEDALDSLGLGGVESLHISGSDLAKAFNRALDKSLSQNSVTRIVKRMILEKQVAKFVLNPSRSKERGYLWNPTSGTKVNYEAKDKLFRGPNG